MCYVWLFINEQEQSKQDELYKRFSEEMKEAHGTCFTGHLSRIVNVVSGFHPNICIGVSLSDQIYSKLQQVIQQLIEETDEKSDLLLEAMISTDSNNIFKTFISKKKNEILKRINTTHLNILYEAWNKMFPMFPDLLRPNESFWQRIIRYLKTLINNYK